jgi:hypothetical protein
MRAKFVNEGVADKYAEKFGIPNITYNIKSSKNTYEKKIYGKKHKGEEYEIYKNPTSLESCDIMVPGLADINGNLFIANKMISTTHAGLAYTLEQQKEIEDAFEETANEVADILINNYDYDDFLDAYDWAYEHKERIIERLEYDYDLEHIIHMILYGSNWDDMHANQHINETIKHLKPRSEEEINTLSQFINNIKPESNDKYCNSFTFNQNIKNIIECIKKNIRGISDNEVDRFIAFTLQDIYDEIPDYYFREKNLEKINQYIEREIQSYSNSWMSMHSDNAIRKMSNWR